MCRVGFVGSFLIIEFYQRQKKRNVKFSERNIKFHLREYYLLKLLGMFSYSCLQYPEIFWMNSKFSCIFYLLISLLQTRLLILSSVSRMVAVSDGNLTPLLKPAQFIHIKSSLEMTNNKLIGKLGKHVRRWWADPMFLPYLG